MTENNVPPVGEANRQKIVHALRARRLALADKLESTEFADNSVLYELQNVNSQVEMLKYLREPYPDTDPEPTLESVEDRGRDWYWEPWEEDDDDE